VNYCAATGLLHEDGQGGRRDLRATAKPAATSGAGALRGQCHRRVGRCARQKDGEARARPAKPMVAPSQGVHLVVDREFLPGDHALMVPKTADGRVLFAVPWLGKVILGTTDTPRATWRASPTPFAEEVASSSWARRPLPARAPTRADVKRIWVGLRPLVKPQDDDGDNTKGSEPRAHGAGQPQRPGHRHRRQVDHLPRHGRGRAGKCVEQSLLPGFCGSDRQLAAGRGASWRLAGQPAAHQRPPGLHSYGSEPQPCRRCRAPGTLVVGGALTEAMVRFAARHEYARTVEDVLARRSRMLFLDARAAADGPGTWGDILAEETGGPRWPPSLRWRKRYLHIAGRMKGC
jgi:glycerol-3-phosphate dehydrogenase